MIETILFDLDGTLTNTIEELFLIIKRSSQKLGKKITQIEILNINKTLLDKNFKIKNNKTFVINLFYKFGTTIGLSKAKSLLFVLICILDYKSVYKKMSLYDDTMDSIIRLKNQNYNLGLVTTQKLTNVVKILPKELISNFNVIITRENVQEIKPDPEGIQQAMKKLKTHKEKTIYIGDFPHDIIASNNANIKSIALNTGFLSEKVLTYHRPTTVCNSLAECVDWVEKFNSNISKSV